MQSPSHRNRKCDPLKHWTRPEREECPICLTTLPLKPSLILYKSCCGYHICMGCVFGQIEAHSGDRKKGATCPFCRHVIRVTDDRCTVEQTMKLVAAGKPDAMHTLGQYYLKGEMGMLRDRAEGMKWYCRAIEAGSANAAFSLGMRYCNGDGVDQDDGKALGFYHKAADLGYVNAYDSIGNVCIRRGEMAKAMLNYRKAMMCGVTDQNVTDRVRNGYKEGFITKDEYMVTLREHQQACVEMKSLSRDKYNKYLAFRMERERERVKNEERYK